MALALICLILYFLILEPMIYGVFAILVVGRDKKRQSLKVVGMIAILLFCVGLMITPIVQIADLRVGNPEIVKMLGSERIGDLFELTFVNILSNLVFIVIEALVGLFLAKKLLSRIGFWSS